MTTDLRTIVGAEAGAIADHVRHGLQSEKTPHYRVCSDRLLRLRCQRLVDAFIEATDGDPQPFVSYVRTIATRRMAERVGLDELQRALTLLEGRAWTTVSEHAAIGHLLDDLQLVTRTIGLAKDELAQRYLAGARRAADLAAELEVPALFAGTDAIPETDAPAH